MRTGYIQLTAGENPADNLDRTIEQMRVAAGQGAQIVCTQELFCSRYFCQTEDPNKFDLAEPIPGPTTERLQNLAAELDIVIIASLFEKRMRGLYHNTAAVIDAGGEMLGIYRKMHIPDDPEYYEKYYFTPGDLGFRVWDTRYGKLAVLICWDQWFPEAARAAALQGAEILFYPTAIGWHDHESEDHIAQHEAWQTMQRSHAIANGVFVVAVNRVGREDQLTFFGQSFVSDPFGRVLHRSPTDSEETIVLDLNPALIEATRRDWPFLRDRRIESYGDLSRRGR